MQVRSWQLTSLEKQPMYVDQGGVLNAEVRLTQRTIKLSAKEQGKKMV